MQNRKSDDTNQLVTFLLGKETYGIDIFKIREVIRSQRINSIPKSPEFIEGVIEVRNHVIPVINLKRRLGIPEDNVYGQRIIILDLNGRLLGIVVDDISRVLKLQTKDYEVLPDMVAGDAESSCIACIAKTDEGLVIIISTERILTHKERMALNNFEKSDKQGISANAS